jgi:hypothetical protein
MRTAQAPPAIDRGSIAIAVTRRMVTPFSSRAAMVDDAGRVLIKAGARREER